VIEGDNKFVRRFLVRAAASATVWKATSLAKVFWPRTVT
jgi:hypothetical protein